MKETKVRVYTPIGLDGHELCHPTSQDDFERINALVNGTSRRSEWKPISVQVIHEEAGNKLVASDSPWLGAHALIFRANVVKILGNTLRAYGELLPLACSDEEVVVYNPTSIVDALDEAHSSVMRFGDGRLMMVLRHVFVKEAVRGVEVFKIPNLRVCPTFVGQDFVDRWKSSGLRGLEFKQVWAASE